MAVPLIVLKAKDLAKSFTIDIRSFYKNRVYLQHHLHVQPSELENLPYYEFQWMMKDMVEMLEKQNGKEGNSMDVDEKMNNMKNQAKSYTSGFGNMSKGMGNMKMPKF